MDDEPIFMDPMQFRRQFRADNRLERGAYFSSSRLVATPSDHVGVVLLSLGGPRDRSDLESFLYRRWMDPVLFARGRGAARHRIAQLLAAVSGGHFWSDYEEIGGECPSVRLLREQASALESTLNTERADERGVTFSTFVAFRYGTPSPENTLRAMVRAGVTKVVLLPAHPQYSLTTTGTSLAYWSELTSRADSPAMPTTAVVEYSAHPLYVQALSERIDQALQRFPKRLRPSVEIVFCAEHEQVRGRLSERDSFCDLAQTTVTLVADLRGASSGYEFACSSSSSRGGSGDQRYVRNVMERLVGRKTEAVLVVPLGATTDRVWTANTLDIRLRQAATDLGIRFFEVASGLNCHPLFVSALADVVGEHVSTDGGRLSTGARADVGEASVVPAPVRGSGRISGCPTCRGPVRAREWGSAPRHGAAHL